MASIILPLHGKGDVSVHRQLMFDAARGKGFGPDFMQRTMVFLGIETPSFFKKDPSERQKRKAIARKLYLARCQAQQRINPSDRAGVTLRIQRNMVQRLKDAVAA